MELVEPGRKGTTDDTTALQSALASMDAKAGNPQLNLALSKPAANNVTLDLPEKVDAELTTILSWPREHDSFGERRFCEWLFLKITQITKEKPELLAENCMYIHIPHPGELMATNLFSCHVDTQDRGFTSDEVADLSKLSDKERLLKPRKFKLPKNPKDNQVGSWVLDKPLEYDMGIIGLAKHASHSMCLGADDGAGVWLMLQMLRAKVPGGYIFHRGEERGGIGSNAILKSPRGQEVLKKYEIAVAFDRRGTGDVIATQGGQECASLKFGNALAAALSTGPLDYKISHAGSFTDTKVYRMVIPECANVSIGYYREHGPQETLDYSHLLDLRDALATINWQTLPVDRDPAAILAREAKLEAERQERMAKYNGGGHGHGYGSYAFGNNSQSRGGGNSHGGYVPEGRRKLRDLEGTYWDESGASELGAQHRAKWSAQASMKDAEPALSPSQLAAMQWKLTEHQRLGPKNTVVGKSVEAFESLTDVKLEDLMDWARAYPVSAAKMIVRLMLQVNRQNADAKLLMEIAGLSEEDVTLDPKTGTTENPDDEGGMGYPTYGY